MTSEIASFSTRLRKCFPCLSDGKGDLPVRDHDRFSGEKKFSPLALELFAIQFAQNPAYRRICEARGATPATVEHWTSIPAVPAAAFKELELSCLEHNERIAVFHSSGTTGQQPSRHFHSTESLRLYEDSLWPWFERHVLGGLKLQQWRLLILTPPPAFAPNSSLVHMLDTVQQRSKPAATAIVGTSGNDGTWNIDLASVEAALRDWTDSDMPLVLVGTAFNFIHLLDALTAKGLESDLPAGSRVMETGGYKGRSRKLSKSELHMLIEVRLGVQRSQIISEYGMSELSSQAYDGVAGLDTRNLKPETRTFRFPPWCRARIISPETGREVAEGETGLVRLYDLANAFSVMAIQTEDMAIRRGEGFELIGRAVLAAPRGCSLMQA